MVTLRAARPALLPFGLLFLIGALWGSFYVLIKTGTTGGVPPTAYLFWFAVGGGTVLAGIAAVRRSWPRVSGRYVRYCLLVGLIRFALANVAFYSAQERLPVGVMAVVMAMTPIFTYGISLVIRIERFVGLRFAGILCGFAGVAMIVAPEGSLPDPADVPWVLIGLAAPFLHGIGYNLLSEGSRPPGADSLGIGFGTLYAAALWILPVSVATGQFRWIWPPFTPGELALITHAVLAGFNFYAIFELIRIAGPTFMSQANFLAVGFGIVFGMVVYNESHSLFVWLAMGLIVAGVMLVNARRSAASAAGKPTRP